MLRKALGGRLIFVRSLSRHDQCGDPGPSVMPPAYQVMPPAAMFGHYPRLLIPFLVGPPPERMAGRLSSLPNVKTAQISASRCCDRHRRGRDDDRRGSCPNPS